MIRTRRLVLVLAAVILLVAFIIAAVVSRELAFVAIGALQIAILVVVLEAHPAVGSKLASVARRARKTLRAGTRRIVSRLPFGRGIPAAASDADRTNKSASSHARAVAAKQRRQRQEKRAQDAQLIRASLVFDQEWYEAQAGSDFEGLDDAILDYLVRGRRAGFTAHPLFNQRFVQPADWAKTAVDPLVAYLQNHHGMWAKATSPLFHPDELDDRLPDDEFGPLSAFLRNRGSDAPLPYSADEAFVRPGLTLEDVRPTLFQQCSSWREIERSTAPTRGTTEVPETPQELIDARHEFTPVPENAPLVSVILPTWNRGGVLRTAIESIARQSYGNWELIVADDGSIDDTLLVLETASARDPRIVPLALPHRGVSAARNAALARARGEYVAFLDSDKEWEPDFLLSMIAFLEKYGHDAGYAIVEVTVKGKSHFRTAPATRESLKVANSIDQTAIVARRSLVERAGGFDESLLRAVDYDLVLSLSEITDLVQVPYVGVRYSEDDQDPNRISEAQSVAWNFYVRDRRRWSESEVAESVPGLVSIVIDGARASSEVHRALASLRQHLGGVSAEVLIIPATPAWITLQTIALAELSTMDVRVLPLAGSTDRGPLRINHALRAARGEYVYVTTAQHVYQDGSISELIDALNDSDAAAVHPVVVGPNRLVADAGVVYAPVGKDPIGLLEGMPPEWADWVSTSVAVPGATLPLLLRASTVRAMQGFNTKLKQLWVDVDASQRAARAESKPVVVRTDNVVQVHDAPVFARREGTEPDVRMFTALWPVAPAGSNEAIAAAGASAIFEGFTAISAPLEPSSWSRAAWRPRDSAFFDSTTPRPERPLQWAIKTAAPADERALAWGDFHFAQSMASALRSLGQRVSVDFGPNAARASGSSDDVVLNLRGLKTSPLPANATSVIWVISHPDQVTARELAAYDLRYAASATWPLMIADQWGIQIEPLLQCTDPDRFYIDDEPIEEVQGKLLMVGNSRRQYRPAACETSKAGFPVAIYGNDWEEFVGAEHIAGRYVANEVLRRYYRSAQWALNDHWPDMRDQGFISNRIFDVFASGGRLLTDNVNGLDGLFPTEVLPHGVATFDSPVDLLAIAETGPVKYYSQASLEAVSLHVRTTHSFRARAEVILEDVRRLRSRDLLP